MIQAPGASTHTPRPGAYLPAAAAALIALLAAGDAEARHPQALNDGINAYNQVEYTPALMYLKAALQQARRREELATTYFYLGCTYLGMERGELAREAFETLLSFEPGYVPDPRLTSPKIASFFSRVHGAYPTPPGPPSLQHRKPRRAHPRLTRLQLTVRNLSPRLRPVLRYRESASPSYFTLESRQREDDRATFAATTPADGGTLLYYFALMDRQGVEVQRLGGPRQPFRLRIPAAAAGDSGRDDGGAAVAAPWYKTWWFWTAAGAVAVGAGLGLGLGLSGADEGPSAKVTILRRDSSGNSVPIFAPAMAW